MTYDKPQVVQVCRARDAIQGFLGKLLGPGLTGNP